MDQYDEICEIPNPMQSGEFDVQFDIPEPIDQWAVEDFDQFAFLSVDTE